MVCLAARTRRAFANCSDTIRLRAIRPQGCRFVDWLRPVGLDVGWAAAHDPRPIQEPFRPLEWHGVPTYRLYPLLMVGGCIGYATLLTVLQGDWTNAASVP